jgi:RNA polymerase sigma-70 factor (ECF subfamily)
MASESRHPVLRFIRRLKSPAEDTSDGCLLSRFAAQRDEAAFNGLVRRHGTMVLAVCRRVLENEADAEDAFQATFLVLARHARSIARPGALASWLYGVAYRTALRAKVDAARRRVRERQAPDAQMCDPADEAARRDLRQVLDAELSRLPERYRVPLVLCYLEGRTQEDVARQLGCPRQTITTRLTRACDRLRGRLARRGVVLPAAALATALSEEARAAGVRLALVEATNTAAALFAASETAADGVVSARVAALTRGVERGMSMTKLKTMFAVLLTASVIGSAAGLTLHLLAAEQDGRPKLAAPGAERPKEAPAKTDQEKLQGAWSLVAAEGGPGKASAEELKRIAGKMEFAGGKVVWEHSGDAWDATFQLDTTREPRTIDIDLVGEAYHGIYQLDGDRLTVCLSRLPGERPAAFAAKAGSRFPMLLVYQRSDASDHARLQGTWTVTTHEIEGDRSNKHGYKGSTVVFDRDRMTITKPGKGKEEATFRLDPATSPKAMDLTPQSEKGQGKTLAGIYLLEGDTLKLCLPTLPGRKRPADFASTPGHLQVKVLKREKK